MTSRALWTPSVYLSGLGNTGYAQEKAGWTIEQNFDNLLFRSWDTTSSDSQPRDCHTTDELFGFLSAYRIVLA